MTRPRYETADDRVREKSAAQVFAERYRGITVEKMSQGAFADFEIFRDGELVGYMEVKTRRCPSTQYDTYHVSKSKLDTLQTHADKSGLRATLLVQWTDRIGWVDADVYLAGATFKEGGRWDRNDPHDVELMAEYPINKFRMLS